MKMFLKNKIIDNNPRKKPAIIHAHNLRNSRNSIVPNPLQLYNPTSLSTFAANQLVTKGDGEFIGGNSQTLTYDFFTKVAGSVTQCPLKIYSNSIDPANPPAPNDASWNEIVNQSIIDKLKLQNDIPITSVNTSNRTAVWNSKNLVLQSASQPAIRDDFAGKIAGSLTANPNIAKANSGTETSLILPSATSWIEFAQSSYTSIITQDTNYKNTQVATGGVIPQQLIVFNIIREIEDKYGTIPGATIDDKITWAKNNISEIDFNPYAYGVCPNGNKILAGVFFNDAWYSNTAMTDSRLYNNTGTVKKMNLKFRTVGGSDFGASIPLIIQSDGCIYFNLYTDASDGTTDSVIYTDYVNIEIQFKAPQDYDILVPSNPRRDSVIAGNYDNCVLLEKSLSNLTADYTGKISGSTTENPNILEWDTTSTTLLAPSSFDYESPQNGYDNVSTLNGTCAAINVSNNGMIPQVLFKFNILAWFESHYGTIQASDKIAFLRNNIQTITANWTGYGVNPNGNKGCFTMYKASAWSNPPAITTSSTSATIGISAGNTDSYGIKITDAIDSNGFVYCLAYTDASDGVTASTIYTDYISITISFINNNNALEFFTNNAFQLENQVLNKSPAYMVEVDMTAVTNALYGGSNSALKSALQTISVTIYAQGSGVLNGNLANNVSSKFWMSGSSIWGGMTGYNNDTNIHSFSILKSNQADSAFIITSDNKFYFIIYPQYPSDGIIESTLNLDFVKATINLTRNNDVISGIVITL